MQSEWLRDFFHELVVMPRRHIVVFLIATVLLVLVEVELTGGWHLIHIIGVMAAICLPYFVCLEIQRVK